MGVSDPVLVGRGISKSTYMDGVLDARGEPQRPCSLEEAMGKTERWLAAMHHQKFQDAWRVSADVRRVEVGRRQSK